MRYIRISPRKFRQIIPIVKGKNPEDAIIILGSVKKGASKYAIDLISSAVANAKRIQGVDVNKLYISRLIANCGPQLKRFRAASMGRASSIRKRTSHLIVELDEMRAPQPRQPDAAIAEKPKAKKTASHKTAAPNAQVDPAKAKRPKARPAKPEAAKKTKE